MSQSPFQNTSPETADDEAETPSSRRLQSPAERFGAEAEAARAGNETSPFDESLPQQSDTRQPDNEADSEADSANDASADDDADDADDALEPLPWETSAPDPFQRLPREGDEAEYPAPRGKRGAATRRARRRLKQHEPHHHEKKPHAVGHKPIKAGAQAEPPDEWDKAAQNSMARAALARRKSRVRRIVGRIVLASGVLLALWGVGTALTAPQFNVNRVEISGTDRTPPKKLENLTTQLIGQNVFRAPKARIESAIEAIPTVAEARIARVWSWPPHMKVQVTERQPLLQVGAGTNWWVVDAQGVAFRRADSNDSQLYMLTSPQLKPVLGKALPAAQWKRARELQAALDADNALAARENGGSQSEASAAKFWDLRRVYLDENSAAALRISDEGSLKQHGEALVRLGEEGWGAKLKQARTALAFFERTGRKVSELDLVSSEHPRWRPKAEQPADEPTEAQKLETTEG